MEKMKKKARNEQNSSEKNSGEVPKQKERHIVSWSPEEDDILREQIEKYGTDNWTIIASKFKDKTTRQCRRRWYTYLNSDFKKGGWSPEEDLLLCEAQKIFGNRWTEIAKVVSGRTDNAVKNRFSTLCKKRAKHEALAKENNAFINLNNKRVVFPNGLNGDGVQESAPSLKKMRSDISSASEAQRNAGKPTGEYVRIDQILRPPFTVLAENFRTEETEMLVQEQHNKHDEIADATDNKAHGTYLKKDDPRILSLLQQAELLSSLAHKVNSDDTDHSLENAWQVLQDYLNQTKDGDLTKAANLYSSCDLVSFKELIDYSSSNECSQQSLRQPDRHTSSPCNSDYSTGSTRLTHPDYGRTESSNCERNSLLLQGIEAELHSTAIGDQRVDHLSPSEPVQENGNMVYENTDVEFSSPIQVTPLFRSLAAAVPTPNFSESERHFLLRALGLETTSPNPSGNNTKPPPCKRVLLHSL